MMVSPHKHEILAITTLMTQFFLNWRRLTESQVQKHRQRQWSLGGCVAKSALNPPVRRACGGNQNRQWLPFHQLTHWNHINPQGVTVPSGILYYKWREIHIAALVRQQEQAKAPHRCKKKKKRGLQGCGHKTDAFPLPTATLQVHTKQGTVIWSEFCL